MNTARGGRYQARIMRVLVVDDSPRFASAATRFLSLVSEVDVIGQAYSGREALDQVDRLHPDVVLIDVRMPDMDGLEATRRIKELLAPPQVIVLTLHDNAEYRQQAARVGADGFVSKREFGTALLSLLASIEGARPS
jgi:DNA-binding NarL/FixJ family response regulator